ncbi:hypothetical protein BDK51DRAFT_41080 [Blyttiomyces helicus]|uniref:Cyclic nucleotide-binding domain-containing protein n=1 Tax=Blyttiomyces helicus TaxID=388810 RepID=A0A4P9WJE1_9FUNG|nr:hypothetical protein BDK51DRAFT_41080 [Blyttiomyces helicus]|eukprot:RKO92482.1 hypothetical protein BDK51DRAFT_41080 [Blyttiomyces helicus]
MDRDTTKFLMKRSNTPTYQQGVRSLLEHEEALKAQRAEAVEQMKATMSVSACDLASSRQPLRRGSNSLSVSMNSVPFSGASSIVDLNPSLQQRSGSQDQGWPSLVASRSRMLPRNDSEGGNQPIGNLVQHPIRGSGPAANTSRRGSIAHDSRRASSLTPIVISESSIPALTIQQSPSYRKSTATNFFMTAIGDSPDRGSRVSQRADRAPPSFRQVARLVAHSVHFVRFLARILKNPIEWSWEYDPYSDDESRSGKPTGIMPGGYWEAFGVSKLFKKPKFIGGWIDPDMRRIFRKNKEDRSAEDIERMVTWCSTMKGMQRYSQAVQRKLLENCVYRRWQIGRVLTREGHPASTFYIILDGEVEVCRIDHREADAARKKTAKLAAYASRRNIRQAASTLALSHTESVDEEPEDQQGRDEDAPERSIGMMGSRMLHSKHHLRTHEEDYSDEEDSPVMDEAYLAIVGKMGSGESFGDLSFIHNTVRAAMIRTRRETEFLCIDGEDYMNAIRGDTYRGTSSKDDAMRSLAVLQSMTDFAQVAHSCMMVVFPPDSVIVVEGTRSENIYLLWSGTCRVIKAVKFIREATSSTRARLHTVSSLPALSLPTASTPGDISTSLPPFPSTLSETGKLLVIDTLTPGAHFGSGSPPSLSGVSPFSIVANGRVECAVLAKIDLNRLATSATWKLLREDALRRPSIDLASKEYVVQRRWDAFKKRVLEDVSPRTRRPVTAGRAGGGPPSRLAPIPGRTAL